MYICIYIYIHTHKHEFQHACGCASVPKHTTNAEALMYEPQMFV